MAYVNTFSISHNASSNALFQSWCNVISYHMQQSGLVKTADTGQIDVTTVAVPGTTHTVAGYEIYRFDDALQLTAPVFVKIEYGTNNSSNGPGLWLSFGTGTNGAGTLTGLNFGRVQCYGGHGSATHTGRISGDQNRVTFFAPATSSTTGYFFNIERTHNVLGNDTSEGILLLYKITTTNRQVLWTPSGQGPDETSWGILTPSTGNTGQTGSDTTVYPVFLNKGTFLNPCMNVLGYFQDNIPAGIPISFSYYGATRQYYPLGTGDLSGTMSIRAATPASTTMMMRWET